jgi:hypothetical protein
VVLAAVALLLVAGGGLLWLHLAPAPPPKLALPIATEQQLRAEVPATLTVTRFAANPAILVLDFPTLAEQGRMLNRLAAWAEKRGVPHDRLLSDAELAAAISASGATPDTYYYGHDYRAADIDRFFALAEHDHVPLNPDEQALRAIIAKARAEPLGFGALITLPRADAANQVDPLSRAVILHHELSHGEYFTNPSYARFVGTVWRDVLTEPERASFRTYLSDDGYDPGIEDLMINEMQAYLMHTPDRRFFDPATLGIEPQRLAAIRESFVAGMPSGWLHDETSVNPVLPRRRRRRRGQRFALVSRRTTAAVAVSPRRRRSASAACKARR